MPACNHCAKCCFFPTGEKSPEGLSILKKCPNLVLKNGRSTCRVYGSCLGLHIGTDDKGIKYYCMMYNALEDEIVGCPLNLGGKPLRVVTLNGRHNALQEPVVELDKHSTE